MGSDDEGVDAAADDSVWCRRFRFGGLRVVIEEEFGAGLGGTVWGGAVALARHLSENGAAVAAADELGDGAPLVALELGAGCCGLPSIVTAHCGRFARVIATDWCAHVARPSCRCPVSSRRDLAQRRGAATASRQRRNQRCWCWLHT
jgi:hypothetical protein